MSKVNLKIRDTLTIVQTPNHDGLFNLDYESSGHVGFASINHINVLETKKIDKNLSILPLFDIRDKKAYLYVNNSSNESFKIEVGELIPTRTIIAETPINTVIGDYIILKEKGEN